MRCELPAWVRSRVGSGRVLLIAPHGGLSERDLLEPPSGPARSNDLYTAELALALAERCDASLLANTALDRNQLDLNRLRDVRTQAPWLLEAIAEQVERILERHGDAEIVFVHGWHIVQPKCDIGVGETLDDDRATSERPGLTVSAAYLRARLDRLRAGCARAGIATAYGERWPAAHPNNLMQVFRCRSTRSFDGPAAPLAAWARAGRICATQLELGAPLRWPGRMREAFCDAAIEAFGAGGGTASAARKAMPKNENRRTASSSPGGDDRDRDLLARSEIVPGPVGGSLRVFDSAAGRGGMGIAAAMGVMPGGRLAARLIVLPGGPALALFTGEERSPAAGRVGGLSLERSARGVHLSFVGPVLFAPDGGRHFRSEAEQAKARIVPLRLQIDFAADGAEFGAARGEVEIDGHRVTVDAPGFATPPLSRTPSVAGGSVTRLCAAFGAGAGLVATVEEPAGEREGRRFSRGTGAVAAVGEMRPFAPPREFALALDGEPLRCRPRGHLAWLRSLPDNRYARVTIGTADFSWNGESAGAGFFEHVEDVSGTVGSALTAPATDRERREPVP